MIEIDGLKTLNTARFSFISAYLGSMRRFATVFYSIHIADKNPDCIRLAMTNIDIKSHVQRRANLPPINYSPASKSSPTYLPSL